MDMSGPSHHKLVVYLNGKFIPKEKAFISVMDRGFLFGDGVYEVFPVYNNNIIGLKPHLNRLQDGLDAINIKNPYSNKKWISLIRKIISLNKNNIIFSNINYDLCPTVSLQIICEQVIEAIIWIYNNCEIYGADKNCITISGHSAGAHLVSYILSLDWEKYNLPYNLFKGAALVSGIYDLEIVRKLTVNDDVKLNAIDAKNLTTINKLPYYKMPIIISYGEDEPLGWKDQSIKYEKFLKKNNFNIDLILCKKNNHFTLIDTLALEESTLCKKIINLSNISNE